MKDLSNKRVAILATNGFEESELREPKKALEDANATVHIVSPESGSIKSWATDNWGKSYSVDRKLSDVSSDDYDALVLPGGVINPDQLRMNKDAIEFIRSFFEAHKPVAAICHAPQLLTEAGVVEGRRLTSYDSIKTDLKNAGAIWVDEEVVVDNGLVTSRNPNDLPAFNAKMIEEIKEGKHAEQMV
ncbi:MAG: type 1 glutamine amidotransferase domain-containing protein [Chitinophagales bacterium]